MNEKKAHFFQDVGINGAARLSGLPITMVNYLGRTDVLVPSRPKERKRGRARRYILGDVVMLRILASLLESGISVARLKKGLKAFRKYHPKITPTSLPARYLVTDGIQVYLRQENQTLETLDEKGQMTFAFVVEIRHVRADVLEADRRLRPATTQRKARSG